MDMVIAVNWWSDQLSLCITCVQPVDKNRDIIRGDLIGLEKGLGPGICDYRRKLLYLLK